MDHQTGTGKKQPNASDGPSESLQPLIEIRAGARVKVVRLDGGRAIVQRLAGLGVRQGVVLSVARNGGGGPLLIQGNSSRFALGRGEAAHILVTREA